MFSPFAAHNLLIVIVIASIVLMLVRPRGIAEVYWICAGALLLVGVGLVPVRLAGRAVAEGLDVYLFLAGMMLLSELARYYGVFTWMASVAEQHANGSAVRLFTLVYLVGAAVTIVMSNDATAVVLTPAVFAAVRRSKTNPVPHMFACALIANAASFVLPISNPANLVVFRTQMPPLAYWLRSFAVPSLLSIVATYLVLRWCFRRELRARLPVDEERTHLTGTGRLALWGIVLEVVVLIAASAMNIDLGLPTCACAVAIAAAITMRSRMNPMPMLRDISWSVLPLVAGLFVLVEAMDSVGAMQFSAQALRWAERLPAGTGALVTAGAVGLGNNLGNNLPLGLIAGSTLKLVHARGLIANAVLIGVDLGTILWSIALRREGLHVRARDFLKVGAIAMPVALALAIGSAILLSRYSFQ